MLVFTGAVVCLCLCAAAPGLGIPVSVTLAPALLRACVIARREEARGQPLTPGGKLLAFIRSFGIMLLVCFATLVSFVIAAFTICIAGNMHLDSIEMTTALVLSSAVAIGAFAVLTYAFWPKRRSKTDG
jgi:hypothetical protein